MFLHAGDEKQNDDDDPDSRFIDQDSGFQISIAFGSIMDGDPFAIGDLVSSILRFREAYVNLIQSLVKSIFYRRFAYKIWNFTT